MRTPVRYILMVVYFICASAGASVDDVPAPFHVRIDRSTVAGVSTYNRAPVTVSGTESATASARGTEASECRPYGRLSGGNSTASAVIRQQTRTGIGLHITARTDANGGHFRRCVECLRGICVGLLPEDTTASSRATATVRIVLEAAEGYPATDFDLVFASSGRGGAPVVMLARPGEAGRVIDTRAETRIRSGKGQIYYLDVNVDVASTDKGACCADSKFADISFDVRWTPSAILDSKRHHQPFIVGGETTSSFPNVGVFLLNGRTHCTGTVLGRHSILTAAHCVWDREAQRDRLVFVLGPNANQWTGGPFRVQDWKYPRGEVPGYLYNPITLEDDIAVVFVEPALTEQPVRLPPASLDWPVLKARSTQFTFVGYGYDRVDGQLSGHGAKREGTWGISDFTNRQVFFSVEGLNTCKGDSGGPGFWVDKSEPGNRRHVQVMITSKGDWDEHNPARSCTQGVQTRLDAYLAWLKGNIR